MCKCVGNTSAPRGVDLSDPECGLNMNNIALADQKFDFVVNSDNRMVNMAVWVFKSDFGDSFSHHDLVLSHKNYKSISKKYSRQCQKHP